MDKTNTKKKILIVEDDAPTRNIYSQVLTEAGYLVTAVDDGEKGSVEFQNGGYDLVILDVMLPKMDGIGILTKAKEDPPKNPNGPVLLLTNLSQNTTLAEARLLGANEILIKSDTDPGEILKKVKGYLLF